MKEDGTTENPEVTQLLNGDIVGTLICFVSSCYPLTESSPCSSARVLRDARRAPSAIPSDRKVRVKSGRDYQERVLTECARIAIFRVYGLIPISQVNRGLSLHRMD